MMSMAMMMVVSMVLMVTMVELLHNSLRRCLLMLSSHPKICSLVFFQSCLILKSGLFLNLVSDFLGVRISDQFGILT